MTISSSVQSGPLRIIPLGGLGEIGMNCMVLEHGDDMIVIDCGLLFSDLDHFGVEFAIPDFSYIRDRKEKLKGYVLTHGHEDHIGALPFALKAGLNAPVFASTFTSLLLREKLKEYSLTESVEIKTFRPGDSFKVGSFEIRPVAVNHSIVDSCALFIETPVGRVIHTGDFKFDPTPYIGEMTDVKEFSRAGDEGVLLLMSDSTNVERHEHSLSESVIYTKFEEFFAQAQGLTIVAMFASNVARVGQIIEIAKKQGKKIALSGRSMDTNTRLGTEAGYLKDVESVLIPMSDVNKHPRHDVIVVSTGSQAEYRSSLTRMAQGEHPHIKLQKGDLILMSSKFIPGNEKAIGRMINNLFRQGAEVLYESVHDIHTSGHATRPELRQMLDLVRPKFFVPVHGEYRHLVHHAGVGRESGVLADNVVLTVNGDVLELLPDSCKIVEHTEEQRVLVEGRDGNDVSRLVLKERRQLGEKGIMFVLIVRNAETRRVIAGPDVIARGLANDEVEEMLLEDSKKIAAGVIERYEASIGSNLPELDLQETVRVELRRYLNQNLGKKPIVLPIVLDM